MADVSAVSVSPTWGVPVMTGLPGGRIVGDRLDRLRRGAGEGFLGPRIIGEGNPHLDGQTFIFFSYRVAAACRSLDVGAGGDPPVGEGGVLQAVQVRYARRVHAQRFPHLGGAGDDGLPGGRIVGDSTWAWAGTGPGTSCPSPVDSIRPSAVQSAPVSVQARSCGTRIDTGPVPAGSTVSSHRSLRPSTRRASLTVPPVTASAWSLMLRREILTSSLNAIRKVNAFDPSWLAGMSSNAAVRVSASAAFDTCRASADILIRYTPVRSGASDPTET